MITIQLCDRLNTSQNSNSISSQLHVNVAWRNYNITKITYTPKSSNRMYYFLNAIHYTAWKVSHG